MRVRAVGLAAALSIALTAPALGSGRHLPFGPKTVFGAATFDAWTATGKTVVGTEKNGRQVPDSVYCTVHSGGIEITQFIEVGRVPYSAMQFELVNRGDTPGFGLSSMTEVKLGERSYETRWLSVLRHLELRRSANGRKEWNVVQEISTADRGYLAVREQEEGPWLPIEYLIDDMTRQPWIEFGYDASEAGDEAEIRTARFSLQGFGPALNWCEEALQGNAWLDYFRAKPIGPKRSIRR